MGKKISVQQVQIDEMLRLYGDGMCVKDVAKAFGISVGKTYYMLQTNGCNFRKQGRNRTRNKAEKNKKICDDSRWRSSDIEYLKKNYPMERAEDIASAIGRSKSSVQHKAHKLGIKKDRAAFFDTRSRVQKEIRPHAPTILSSKGYVYRYMPEHPNADKKGRIAEHRVVMEEHIGRILDKGIVVHHINGDKADNRIENLIMMTNAEHTRFHNIEGGRKR
ncbi:MAG: HNH endonuclease [Bacteroidales bacterium]|nr:HNH endonuclease [Bacteroidales bacterium]